MPPALVLKSAVQAREDRIMAGMLLRDAQSQAEIAEEEGVSGYLGSFKPTQRVDERLLKGEVSQLRSFNRRAGVEPLPPPEARKESTEQGRVAALEKEFVRMAHQRRLGGVQPSASSTDGATTRKRPRLGANVPAIDAEAAALAEAQLAEEEEEMAHPLLRGPSGKAKAKAKSKEGSSWASLPGREAKDEEEGLWPSKGLLVMIVDERGRFKESHQQIGVVRRRREAMGTVDVELDASDGAAGSGSGRGGGRLVAAVPQRLLKTVVSATAGRVEVVRGPHRGAIAALVRLDESRDLAVVQLGRARDDEQLEVPLDHICEFV